MFGIMSSFAHKAEIRESKDEIMVGEIVRAMARQGFPAITFRAHDDRQMMRFLCVGDEVLHSVFIDLDRKTGTGMVSQARNLGIDYGVYWSVGAAATRMGLLPRDTGFALAVAISITEKSPFRDIPKRYADINQRTMNDRMINRLWPQFRSIYS